MASCAALRENRTRAAAPPESVVIERRSSSVSSTGRARRGHPASRGCGPPRLGDRMAKERNTGPGPEQRRAAGKLGVGIFGAAGLIWTFVFARRGAEAGMGVIDALAVSLWWAICAGSAYLWASARRRRVDWPRERALVLGVVLVTWAGLTVLTWLAARLLLG